MRQSLRVVCMVLGGIVGGWVGYWLGHLLGWSVDADWPWHVGGGTGAVLMSLGLSVLGVLLARLAVGPRPAQPGPDRASESVMSDPRA